MVVFRHLRQLSKLAAQSFPGGRVVKNTSCKSSDAGLIPGLGRDHMP